MGKKGPKIPTSTDCSDPRIKAFTAAIKAQVPEAKDFEQYPCFIERFAGAKKVEEEVVTLFRNHVQWRKDLDVANIVFTVEEREKIFKLYPKGPHGFDRDFRPVYIERLGKIDVPALVQEVGVPRLLQYTAVECEEMVHQRFSAAAKLRGRYIDKTTTILDLNGLRAGMITREVYAVIRQLIALSAQNYPETMGRVFVVNSPMFIRGVWGFMRGWLDKDTQAKVRFDSSTKCLDEVMDRALLPDFLGGTRTFALTSAEDDWEDIDLGYHSCGDLSSDGGYQSCESDEENWANSPAQSQQGAEQRRCSFRQACRNLLRFVLPCMPIGEPDARQVALARPLEPRRA